ncbi:hypothetical protein [Pseudotabrizicola algicola]|uniref:hypothetical protein n=1 Tax=Pseudotabrizicola algicola TaxID=2709381 RepID=UPI00196855C9|nr:hypothetical protein [Pseudotabrizicola algicola]
MTTTVTHLTFPPEEADLVREVYAAGRVILEYGSGGSTHLAASLPGKFVMAVESDRTWAVELQLQLDRAALPSPAVVWHVDIGPTGRWGRPVGDDGWQRYHHYPLSIWSEPFFRHPDTVLIDGRFRPACFVATAMRITRPVTVLFDDYTDRPAYHVVERFAAPLRRVGRMAMFTLAPVEQELWMQDLLMELCTRRSLAGDSVDYSAAN